MILCSAVRALRTPLIFAALFSLLPSAFALSELSLDKDKEAKSEFLDTFFFSQSRGMHQYPGVIDFFESLFAASSWSSPTSAGTPAKNFFFQSFRNEVPGDFGVQVVGGRFVGVFKTSEPGYHLGVAGCVLCHAGKAAGVFIPGLGNKNVNLKEFAEVGLKGPAEMQSLPGSLILPRAKSEALLTEIDGANRMADILSDARYYSATDGLIENNIVLRTFFEAFGSSYNGSSEHFLNKIPHLWGIEAKRPVGLFVDGGGDGDASGWAVAPEIMWGQRSEEISGSVYAQKILHTEALMNSFLPPPYPFPKVDGLVNRGEKVFSTSCMKCHGSYERNEMGMPVYQAPKLVPLGVVKTDANRAGFFRTPGFWEAAERSSFRDLIKKGPQFDDSQPEYFAPRLDGIWARFPYLHNASVPTLWHLLHPEQRPEVFSVKNAGELERFDPRKCGLTTSPLGSLKYWELSKQAQLGDRQVYWTRREGHSSEGHLFGSELSEGDKTALIEYLKSL